MNRRGAQGRQTTIFRLLTILSLVLMAAVLVLPRAVGAADDNPYSHISPTTDTGRDIQWLYKFIFWGALVAFIGVQFGVVYTSLRYRRRRGDESRPEQVHGNRTLEIVWTILPAVILLVVFIPTVRTMYRFEAKADDGEESGYVIDVYGKQWWWEIHYKQPTEVDGVVTGNEVYLPVGKPVTLRLNSNNVVHSFWVPQLTGKLDVVPGHTNKLGFTPAQVGVYYGECAEFCGESHAYMRFKVIVVEQAVFDQWLAGWKAGPSSGAAALSGDIAQIPQSFGICIACHRVEGTNASVAPIGVEQDPGSEEAPGSAKTAGPNLSMFACRTTIGAGILHNTEENLRLWLHDPGSIKQGNYMATVIKEGTLEVPTADPNDDPNRTNLDVIVDYLKTLHPEGGCPPLSGRNVDAVVQLAPGTPVAVASTTEDEANAS